ncbi:MAG: hypothetical protein QOF46_3145, partial [Paraburkholderia sp.]|nr:hypothetical protein [Paraburkholderia sp.]
LYSEHRVAVPGPERFRQDRPCLSGLFDACPCLLPRELTTTRVGRR